jgi:hypothetical protein
VRASSLVSSAFVVALALPAAAQDTTHHMMQMATPVRALSREELAAFAKLNVQLGKIRDSTQHQLGLPEHLNDKSQDSLRARLKIQLADLLKQNGVSDEEYRHKTYLLSTNDDIRWTYDTLVAQLTGAPLPTKYVAPAELKIPAGPAGVHIGHVLNAFGDTPNKQGLLPVAMAEAKTAAQHAGLAARATSLDAMKLHAGHVLNALDPSLVATGPGLGYGMKKAALGVAMHIELAAKADSASMNVKQHSVHVATAARAAAARADSAIAVAQKIQAATTVEVAQPLVTQLVALTQQLVAGNDANKDGKIGWDAVEGGLQQAQDHMNLMLASEH